MLKKEFNGILKQSLYFVVLTACLPVLLMIVTRFMRSPVSYFELLCPVFQVGLIVIALLMGISLLAMERKQDGIEYLLTLPLSRWKLLAIKILPRLAVLLVFSGLYLLLLQVFTGSLSGEPLLYSLPTALLLYFVFGLFFVGVSFSASNQNFIIAAVVALFVFVLHSAVFYFLFYRATIDIFKVYLEYSHIKPVLLGVFSLLLPLLISFIFAFKRFDVRGGKGFNRGHLRLFIPLFVVGLSVSIFYIYSVSEGHYPSYHLTKENLLVDSGYFNNDVKIYDGEKVTKVKNASGYVLIEHGDNLYLRSFRDYKSIISLNKKNHKVETLYKTRGRFRFSTGRYKDTLALTETTVDKLPELVLINLKTKAVNHIKLPSVPGGSFYSPWIIGADELDGQRFWLVNNGKVGKYSVSRVWEDGRVEKLCSSRALAVYVNRMLITQEKEEILAAEITAAGVEVINRVPVSTRISFYTGYFNRHFENNPVTEIYGHPPGTNGKIFCLDLETFELTWLRDKTGYVRYFYPDKYYYLESAPDAKDYTYTKRISRVKAGKFELLKEFSGTKPVRLFSTGNALFFKEDGKTKIYALPDLKELTFKGLK
ncbi:MAG: hypothetical protein KAW12_21220 [Candidatus Aminicenantes bacterium]|nr:hypothetical protein [Candidatus Aminicenantes bacterium]